MPDFRKIIKTSIKKQKLSIPQLARLVELNQSSIYNYMSGKSEMTSGNLERILEALKINI
jgi:transcriptional regulator with XRE-family HTH domain